MSLDRPTVSPQELQSEPEGPYTASQKTIEGVKEAKNLFISLGLAIENDGLLTNYPSSQNLEKLREWYNQTIDFDIQMPTEKAFYENVLLAISLWRQKEGDKTNYLLGKGIGVEVALRGNVTGRTKRPIEFSYRSHSDFELYGVDYNAGEDGGNTGGKTVYTEPFVFVFGNQEYYPVTKTKGLKNIPPNLLHDTSEIVDFGGAQVLVPQLELLFLDKYIVRETTPRAEGYDAELLARQYILDRAKIHHYLDKLVIEPSVAQISELIQKSFRIQLDSIKRYIAATRREFESEGIDPSLQEIISRINGKMQLHLDARGAEKLLKVSGIHLNLWENLTPEQFDAEGNIVDKDFLQRLESRVEYEGSKQIKRYRDKHAELDRLFDAIDEEFVGVEEKK